MHETGGTFRGRDSLASERVYSATFQTMQSCPDTKNARKSLHVAELPSVFFTFARAVTVIVEREFLCACEKFENAEIRRIQIIQKNV